MSGRLPPFFDRVHGPGPPGGGITGRGEGRELWPPEQRLLDWKWTVQRDHSQRDGGRRGNTPRDKGLRETARDSRSGGDRDDFQLIDEALAGQSASFGELVTKYQDRLYNSVLHV